MGKSNGEATSANLHLNIEESLKLNSGLQSPKVDTTKVTNKVELCLI